MTDPLTDDALQRIEHWQQENAVSSWFGLRPSMKEGQLLYSTTVAPPHMGNAILKLLHGGVISSFLQTVSRLEILARTSEAIDPRIISVHCNYLRPAPFADLKASVEIVQRGRRIAFAEATAWQDDEQKPVARAAVSIRLRRA